ncbi:probable protein phosphatase 2C 68 isoform X1 [Zingiber officinale]|nr:probable protein phosphatase 2C 68 isoform X1 [Zingiber officinale]
MAEICKQATKVSSASIGETRLRRFRIVTAVGEDTGKKRHRVDPGCDYVENHGEDTRNGSTQRTRAALMESERICRARDLESMVGDGRPRYGVTSVRGRRREMEDAVTVRLDFVHRHHFFGVYDGHGCSHLLPDGANWCRPFQVAESCRDRMHEMVVEEISASMPGKGLDWPAIMEISFARMDAEAVACCNGGSAPGTVVASCRCEMQTTKCDHVGSTAVVAVVEPTRIVVANCGDSRAVLCRNGVPVPLSSDHKPDRPDELRRIEEAGGRVIYWDGARVLGVLAMSRAIGDSYLKPYVIAEPEVTVTERKEEDECLILGSDGLWDVVSNEMACEIARTCLRNSGPRARTAVAMREEEETGSDRACSDAALLLTKLALARRSTDNISVVVVDLRTRR